MLKIVIINGGRGASTIIPLYCLEDKSITPSNAYDDGKSTGEIRKFFNMLGPSDIRKFKSFFYQAPMKLLTIKHYLDIGIL